MMKRKASSMLLTAAFLVVLFFPHVLSPLFPAPEGESTEKRTLAEKPVFSLQEIEAYPRAFEEYYNDHLPFRNWLIRMYNNILYYGFKTSSHDNVIVGKDGWLFYKSPTDGTTMECYDGSVLFSDEELERMVVNLTDIRDRLAEQGIEFVVFIAPNKERFYSEYIPDHYGEQAEVCMLTQALDHLRTHTDIRIVYPYEELMEYKMAHPEQNMYYVTDTHWNKIGGYIGARALLAELGIDAPPLEEYSMVTDVRNEGDLQGMLNISGLSEDVSTPVISVEKKPQVLSSNYAGRVEFKMDGAADKKLLMRMDSFGAAMAPCLSQNLSHSVLMHYGQFQPEQIWEEKPDVVVIEIVERYVRWLRNRAIW